PPTLPERSNASASYISAAAISAIPAIPAIPPDAGSPLGALRLGASRIGASAAYPVAAALLGFIQGVIRGSHHRSGIYLIFRMENGIAKTAGAFETILTVGELVLFYHTPQALSKYVRAIGAGFGEDYQKFV